MYRSWGGDVINMTTFPEVVLANEADGSCVKFSLGVHLYASFCLIKGLLYASVALATDYDCWRSEGEHVRLPRRQDFVLY
jgi:5'-methylthioadenosine phosphorylase